MSEVVSATKQLCSSKAHWCTLFSRRSRDRRGPPSRDPSLTISNMPSGTRALLSKQLCAKHNSQSLVEHGWA